MTDNIKDYIQFLMTEYDMTREEVIKRISYNPETTKEGR